ncbi:hypothetical protein D3C76_1014570 [compost metagenome]
MLADPGVHCLDQLRLGFVDGGHLGRRSPLLLRFSGRFRSRRIRRFATRSRLRPVRAGHPVLERGQEVVQRCSIGFVLGKYVLYQRVCGLVFVSGQGFVNMSAGGRDVLRQRFAFVVIGGVHVVVGQRSCRFHIGFQILQVYDRHEPRVV